jgi:hypothetical protein
LKGKDAMNKAAKAARAEMVAKVRAAREALPEPVTCAAAYYDPAAAFAVKLAREAIASGLRFGNSASAADPGHVAGLVLKDAYEGWWREKYGGEK